MSMIKEPEQTNWDNVHKGSTYAPPPPAQSPDGKYIPYFVQLPQTVGNPETMDTNDEGYRRYQMGPVKVVKSGTYDGYEIKFYSTSLKSFIDKKTGQAKGVNSTALVLKGAGVAAKPQSTADYDATVKLLRGKIVPVSIEWRGKSKDGSEVVEGFANFPFDPERPGQRKSILKQGDVLPDGRVIKSEVIFANAQIRFVESPKK